jgi:hypothetical protein
MVLRLEGFFTPSMRSLWSGALGMGSSVVGPNNSSYMNMYFDLKNPQAIRLSWMTQWPGDLKQQAGGVPRGRGATMCNATKGL